MPDRIVRPGAILPPLKIDGAPTGLVGTIGVHLEDLETDETVVARSTADITESPAGSGIYTARGRVAPEEEGRYSAKWDTGGLTPVYAADEDDIVVSGTAAGAPIPGLPDWAPTVQGVASLLHARTNVFGEELGVFNDDTRPTESEVEDIIAIACGDLLSRVKTAVPEEHWTEAQRLGTLQAASLVEASFFPNQLDTDRSAARQFGAMYLSGVASLAEAVKEPSALRLV